MINCLRDYVMKDAPLCDTKSMIPEVPYLRYLNLFAFSFFSFFFFVIFVFHSNIY